jgi:nucleotide-binding universal stress UspA family protein
MSYQEILAPVITLESDQIALSAAAEIAQKFEARATAVIVAVDLASAFAEHTSAFSEILVDLAKGSRSHAALERAKIIAWLEHAPHDFNIRDVTVEDAVQSSELVAHARTADLTVIARSPAHNRARRAMLERVLFKSGRPVLLVPEAPSRERRWGRVMIGWNAKAEAMRAVTGAMPLLKLAREVVVATVDAAPSKAGHGQAPGHDIAARLAGDGVRVEVRNLDSMGRSDGAALIEEAVSFDADMLVLGAYGHSRAQEFLFGGVTRELLAASPIPLFMAH